MPVSVFISYRRLNRPFAARLQLDLRRAGVSAWRDEDDIPLGSDFENVILPAIAAATHVVLLASPDAAESDWVRREVAEALRLGKTVILLRLAGTPGSLPAEWERLNLIEDAALDYWGTVRRLARALLAPDHDKLRSVADLLTLPSGTVAEAAADIAGAQPVTTDDGRRYWQLPVAPSGYGNSTLFAPADAPMRMPRDLAVLFNFTSNAPGTRHLQSLSHWAGQTDAPAWMLMQEGPVNVRDKQYVLRTDRPHEWADAIAAGVRLIQEFAHGRDRLGFYFNSLLPLAFEVGLRTTMLTRRRRVFHFNARPESGPARYELAHDGWV